MDLGSYIQRMQHQILENEEPMSLKELIKILEDFNLVVRDKDKLGPKRKVITVEAPREHFKGRLEAAQVFQKHLENAGYETEMEYYGARPVVWISNKRWRVDFKDPMGQKGEKPADYEAAIAAAWNDLNNIEHDISYKEHLYETGMSIATQVKKKLSGQAQNIGSVSVPDVSEFWKKYIPGRIDKTPKTDILIGDARVSLKMGDSSQLCSAKAIEGEGEAMLHYALQRSGADEQLQKTISEIFEPLRQAAPKDKDALKKEMLSSIQTAFREIARENEEFKVAFVREALTGEGKFQGVATEPIADTLLAASYDATKVALKGITEEYVRKIAPQIQVLVNIKSSGKGRWPAIRITHKHENQIQNILDDVMDNELLEEDIKAFFGKLKDIVKSSVKAFLKWLGFQVEVEATINNINFFV